VVKTHTRIELGNGKKARRKIGRLYVRGGPKKRDNEAKARRGGTTPKTRGRRK